MATILLLKPHEHFDGTHRLLAELQVLLSSGALSRLRIAVAFAKAGPLVKLKTALEAWRSAGKSSQAIIGLSHKGTSQQALELSLQLFDEVYVCYPGSVSSFHPKIYVFEGESDAVVFYGSHNLTVGGTETNFEAGIKLSLSLPADRALLVQANDALDALLPIQLVATKQLDAALLADLVAKEMVFDESAAAGRFGSPTAGSKKGGVSLFPAIFPKPPLALPKGLLGKSLPPKKKPQKAPVLPSTSLAIQIVPHHNGEVFLSKIAINQNPAFFGFPFKGKTVPKKGNNAPYQQRLPDPVVDIAVFNAAGMLTLLKPGFELNTVFYEKKGEIRITISPDLLAQIQPFSILHMRQGDATCDYYFDVFNPGSTLYTALLAACNQTLPSGGSPTSRKMGWL